MTRGRQPGAQPPHRDAAAAPSGDPELPRRRPGAQLPAGSASNGSRPTRTRSAAARALFNSKGLLRGETPADISDDTVLLRIRTALEGLP